jgi:hypothetical protein
LVSQGDDEGSVWWLHSANIRRDNSFGAQKQKVHRQRVRQFSTAVSLVLKTDGLHSLLAGGTKGWRTYSTYGSIRWAIIELPSFDDLIARLDQGSIIKTGFSHKVFYQYAIHAPSINAPDISTKLAIVSIDVYAWEGSGVQVWCKDEKGMPTSIPS